MQRSQSHRDFTNIRPSRNVPDSNRTNLEFDLFPAANDVFVNSNFYMPTTSQLTPVNASVSAMNATLTNTIIRNNEQLTNLIRDNEQLASMERTVEMYLDARAITDRDYDEPPILESNAIDEEIRTSFDGSAPEPARLPSRQQENMFQIPGDINRYAYDTSAVSLLAHITNQGNAEVEALNRQLQHNSNALYFRNHSMSAFTGAAPGGYIIPSSPRMNPFEMYYVLNHSDSAIHGGTYPFVNFASAAQIHSLIHPPNHEQLPVGVSSDQIKKFSTILPFEKDDNGINEEDERCTVCLSEFESGDEIRALPCSHRYHTECIDRWLGINKKCPLCREDIDKNSESNQDTYSTIRVGPSTIPSAQMENVPLPSRVLE
uniref:RING-type domain-containing protein n=1 Tax=Rhabditophanes sp. KR3021 TaxID=114890 RepID=A0AC35TYG1_9BILA